MSKDSLGDRMKDYESRARTYLPRRTYTILRLDGKAFHTYTRGLNKPFDQGFMKQMDRLTSYLCASIQGCKFGYVQSDEITLVLTDFDNIRTDAWFDGQVQKITSVAASMASSFFTRIQDVEFIKNNSAQLLYGSPMANFDARCWVIPESEEVLNCLIWRQQDAIRNSILMMAQHCFGHKEIQNKSTKELIEMLGETWSVYDKYFVNGRCAIKDDNVTGIAPEEYKWDVSTMPVLTENRDWFWNYVPREHP